MTAFRNDTPHLIPLVVNGIRKQIMPGQVIHGPDSLATIPGLSVITRNTPTTINKNISAPSSVVKPPQTTMAEPTYTDISIKTTLLVRQIEDELEYMNKMKNLQKNPSVTLAILTKNRLDLISNCCNSIIEKVKYRDTTIMICDTGTTEDNVKRYYEFLEKKCQSVGISYQYIQLPNYHYSQNYNDVSRYVQTDYFLIQNNDTVAINDYVTEMMGTAVLKKVGSVGPRMFYPDGKIQHDGQFIFHPTTGKHVPGTAGHLNLGKRKEDLPAPEHLTQIVDGNTAAGCLLRTEDFKTILGFDTSYKDIFQDVDLMVKIPNLLKKYNYCNRNAEIIHIDNASRLKEGLTPQKHQNMREDAMYLKYKCDNFDWARKLPQECDFSIVTLVHNNDEYKEFLQSLNVQNGNHKVEIIGIPNFYNQFTSSYKSLNTALDVCSGKYVIFTHDDIIVTPDFLNNIKYNINKLSEKKIKWGVLGPAGIHINNINSAYYLLDNNSNKLEVSSNHIELQTNSYSEVSTLDEMCLIINRSDRLNIRFSDKSLSGFHLYGPDICLAASRNGYKNFAINSYVYHKSDGSKNISSDSGFNHYIDCLKNFVRHIRSYGIMNWRSTTAEGNAQEARIYAAPKHLLDPGKSWYTLRI